MVVVGGIGCEKVEVEGWVVFVVIGGGIVLMLMGFLVFVCLIICFIFFYNRNIGNCK